MSYIRDLAQTSIISRRSITTGRIQCAVKIEIRTEIEVEMMDSNGIPCMGLLCGVKS